MFFSGKPLTTHTHKTKPTIWNPTFPLVLLTNVRILVRTEKASNIHGGLF